MHPPQASQVADWLDRRIIIGETKANIYELRLTRGSPSDYRKYASHAQFSSPARSASSTHRSRRI